MQKLEDREFLTIAKGLMIGEVTKVIHKGCGARPALHIANEADRWWAYCHKCRRSGSVNKTLQRIKVKAPDKTGWVPAVLKPAQDFINEIVLNDRLPEWVWENITVLKYAPDTKRIYLPDGAGHLWGYDATGAATARLYSPYKRPGAVWMPAADSDSVFITSSITRYLNHVRDGARVYLVGANAEYDHCVWYVAEHPGFDYIIDRKANFHPKFIRNLKQFGAKLNGS